MTNLLKVFSFGFLIHFMLVTVVEFWTRSADLLTATKTTSIAMYCAFGGVIFISSFALSKKYRIRFAVYYALVIGVLWFIYWVSNVAEVNGFDFAYMLGTILVMSVLTVVVCIRPFFILVLAIVAFMLNASVGALTSYALAMTFSYVVAISTVGLVLRKLFYRTEMRDVQMQNS